MVMVVKVAVVVAPELSIRATFVKTEPDRLFQLFIGATPAEPVTGLPEPTKWMPIDGALARLNVPPASATAPEPRAELLVTLTVPAAMAVPLV